MTINEPQSVTVLIVDDDRIVGEIYMLSLERAGFRVLVAKDGLSGLKAISETVPDFVFLDIKMPDIDGIEVLRRLAAGEPALEMPIVMLSNFDDPMLVRESLRLGAKEYLIKVNLDPTELPNVVSKWLKQPP